MSKVNPFDRRTYKAPLDVKKVKAARHDLYEAWLEYKERVWESDMCGQDCEHCTTVR